VSGRRTIQSAQSAASVPMMRGQVSGPSGSYWNSTRIAMNAITA
jgi:hypothetical protein